MQNTWNAGWRQPTADHMQAQHRISCEHGGQGVRRTEQSRRETPGPWDGRPPNHWCQLLSSGRRLTRLLHPSLRALRVAHSLNRLWTTLALVRSGVATDSLLPTNLTRAACYHSITAIPLSTVKFS
jgi:hypothetical protein